MSDLLSTAASLCFALSKRASSRWRISSALTDFFNFITKPALITMSDKTIENLRVFTMTNELQIDGHHLIEKKCQYHERVYIRSIDDKSYKVTTKTIWHDGIWHDVETNETDMTEDEVKKFEEDWTNLWNPVITTITAGLHSHLHLHGVDI